MKVGNFFYKNCDFFSEKCLLLYIKDNFIKKNEFFYKKFEFLHTNLLYYIRNIF